MEDPDTRCLRVFFLLLHGRNTVGSVMARLGASVGLLLCRIVFRFFAVWQTCSLPDFWLAGSLSLSLSDPHLQSDSQGGPSFHTTKTRDI